MSNDVNVINGIRRNRMLSSLMDDHHSNVNVGQDFKLKCGREFEGRAQSVFSGLVLEDSNLSKTFPSMDDDDDEEADETEFVKPSSRAPKRRGPFPNYTKPPKKWTKYSLSDVPDHSEKANSKAAADFLASVRIKNMDKSKRGADGGFNTVRFTKKSNQVQDKDSSSSSSNAPQAPTFSRSARVMPEYIVGQKNVRQRRNIVRNEKKEEIRLSHLSDEHDE